MARATRFRDPLTTRGPDTAGVNSTSCAPRRCCRRPWSTSSGRLEPLRRREPGSARSRRLLPALRESMLLTIAVDGWVWPITLAPATAPCTARRSTGCVQRLSGLGRASGGLQAAATSRCCRRNAAALPPCHYPLAGLLWSLALLGPRNGLLVALAEGESATARSTAATIRCCRLPGASARRSRACWSPRRLRNHLPLAGAGCSSRRAAANGLYHSKATRHRGRPARSQRRGICPSDTQPSRWPAHERRFTHRAASACATVALMERPRHPAPSGRQMVSLLMDIARDDPRPPPLFPVGTKSEYAGGRLIEASPRPPRSSPRCSPARSATAPAAARAGAVRLRPRRGNQTAVALAGGLGLVVTARFLDRVGEESPRRAAHALIADHARARGALRYRPARRRSRHRRRLRPAPLLATALMLLWAGDFRAVFWLAVIPARASPCWCWRSACASLTRGGAASAEGSARGARAWRRLGSACWWWWPSARPSRWRASARPSSCCRAAGCPGRRRAAGDDGDEPCLRRQRLPFGRLADRVSAARPAGRRAATLVAADLALAPRGAGLCWRWASRRGVHLGNDAGAVAAGHGGRCSTGKTCVVICLRRIQPRLGPVRCRWRAPRQWLAGSASAWPAPFLAATASIAAGAVAAGVRCAARDDSARQARSRPAQTLRHRALVNALLKCRR